MKKVLSLILICMFAACLFGTAAGCAEAAQTVEEAQPYVDQITWHSFDGLQDGYLVLHPDTEVWDLKFSSAYGDMMFSGNYLEDGTMDYDKEARWVGFIPMDEIVPAGEEIIKAFLSGEVSIVPVDPDTCDHKWWNCECIICGTACEHESWSKGICDVCGLKCSHEVVDETTRLCGQCGKFIPADPADCPHYWNENGVCSMCGLECEHPDWTSGNAFAFDIHTESQKEFIEKADWPSAVEYAPDGEFSHPKALVCDFSADEGIAEAESYIFQKAADADFTDPVTVTGLPEKTYNLYNVMLGEDFFWRGGSSLEDIQNSPVHEVIVSETGPRTCEIEGLMNVRDIGGYASDLVDGGVIRQGLYYRGAAPDGIREAGIDRFVNELGIGAEIDLRDDYQCTGPYVEGVEYYAVPIPSGTEPTRFEEFQEEYCKIFDVVSRAGERPVYLHCSAGADRTGISSFILLTVCGADYEDIAKDYMFTNFSGQKRDITALETWWSKLQAMDGETMADKAATWMLSKGIPEETIENIRATFVEGYAG